MTTKVIRKIVTIDEARCNGCGACITACAEGALQLIDGKAKLISDTYCDGLGACLGECPQGAINIVERVAEEFDEKVAGAHKEENNNTGNQLPCGCPSATVTQLERQNTSEATSCHAACQVSTLGNWPVQLTLVPPKAPFLQGADLVLSADCVPFAYAGFHQDFLKGHALLVACPKLDDFQAHQKKLTDILTSSDVRSLTIAHMEVPCCTGLVHMAKQALKASGKNIPVKEVTVLIEGGIKTEA